MFLGNLFLPEEAARMLFPLTWLLSMAVPLDRLGVSDLSRHWSQEHGEGRCPKVDGASWSQPLYFCSDGLRWTCRAWQEAEDLSIRHWALCRLHSLPRVSRPGTRMLLRETVRRLRARLHPGWLLVCNKHRALGTGTLRTVRQGPPR